MALHVRVLLFAVCFLLSLALLGRLDRFPSRPSSSQGGARRSTLHRLLKPRSPGHCPLCRLASPASLGAGPAPAPVRRLSRGRKPPGSTQTHRHPRLHLSQPAMPVLCGHRCPSPRLGRGWHAWPSRAHPDLSLPGSSHHLQCSTRHLLVSPENPFRAGRCGALGFGRRLDPSADARVFGYRQATITTWLSRADEYAQTLHERCFRHLHISHL